MGKVGVVCWTARSGSFAILVLSSDAHKMFHVYILSCVSVAVRISHATLHVGVHLMPLEQKIYLSVSTLLFIAR